MHARFLIIAVILFSLVPSLAEATRLPIKKEVKVKGVQTGETYTIAPAKKYSLQVIKSEVQRSKIALFDKDGDRRKGEYWIASTELKKVTNDSIQAGIRAPAQGGANRAPGAPCANCEVDEPGNRTEPAPATPEPPAAATPAPAAPAAGRSDLCKKFDSFVAKGVPATPLRQALQFYAKNPAAAAGGARFVNKRYVSIADYSRNSKDKRFFLLDMQTGEVTAEKVSHGGGQVGAGDVGDPNHDGYVDRCEHPVIRGRRRAQHARQNMTRPGFFLASNLHFSSGHSRKWPKISNGRRNPKNSLILEGLVPGVNENAKNDGVFMHEARYNFNGPAKMGRSFGCPAFVPGRGAPIMNKIANGSLFYAYVPACKSDMEKSLKKAEGWESFCK